MRVKSSIRIAAIMCICIFFLSSFQSAIHAEERAVISQRGRSWILRNQAMGVGLEFSKGGLHITSFRNRSAKTDYLAGRTGNELFQHLWNDRIITAGDGGWSLTKSSVTDIKAFDRMWGKRLEISIVRAHPVRAGVRLVFEIYDGDAGLRYSTFLKNETDKPATVLNSKVLSLDMPQRTHVIHYIEGKLAWKESNNSLTDAHRNCIVRYATGDGWGLVPENNWATCLKGGKKQGDPKHPFMSIDAWASSKSVQVSVDPLALQLTLFPKEEVEFMAVNLTVFKGDVWNGRVAVSEHLRKRYKFHDPSRFLSTNDWQFHFQHPRTDANYRNIIIPRASAAGFDHIHFDDYWYGPSDTCEPMNKWTDMESLGNLIIANGMKPGHWFSLQGLYCVDSWGAGRESANPVNIAFKKQQCEDTLIGKYHSSWDQIDAGLLWKIEADTPFSHPGDSVWRNNLGLRHYMNSIALAHPEWSVQTTCEVDNPMDGFQNENVGLLHLAENGLVGMYLRTDSRDNVKDLFDSVGLFPLEGMAATWGEGGQSAWEDSPLWFYQFLLARHTSIYSWPGDWSEGSIKRMRRFNDWRKSPRVKALLNEVVRPVYCGAKDDNNGPWAWMFTNEKRSRALLIALDHKDTGVDKFSAKLRWLDPRKTYLVEDITMGMDGFSHIYRGYYTGAQLISHGLDIDFAARENPCAAFWIEEKNSSPSQVLYADPDVTRYREKSIDGALLVDLAGAANTTVHMVVKKPGGVEERNVIMDLQGKARVIFENETVTQKAALPFQGVIPPTTHVEFAGRIVGRGGNWVGEYGKTAAWLAGMQTMEICNGYRLRTAGVEQFIWGNDNVAPKVLQLPEGRTGSKVAACWTAQEGLTLSVNAPANSSLPYRLTVYMMDYDIREPAWARAADVSILAPGGKVLDTQKVDTTETSRGVYLTWKVTGNCQIRVKKTAGINVAISAVFVDGEQ